MADPRLLYTFPTDEWAHAIASPVFNVGAADADFPLANAFLGNPAIYFQATGTSVSISFNRGAPALSGLIGLIHTNIDGTAVWKRNTAADFSGAGEIYPFTLPGPDQEGYYDGLWADASAGPARQYEGPVITGNSKNIIIGQIFASLVTRVFPHHVNLGSTWGAKRPRVPPLMTAADVQMAFASFGRRRQLAGVVTYDATVTTALDAWLQAAGGVDQPFLIVPKDTVLSSAWYVRFNMANSADFVFTDVETGIRQQAIAFIEVAKGRPLGSV